METPLLRRGIVCLALLAGFTALPSKAAPQQPLGSGGPPWPYAWAAGGFEDRAPAGMPDFSQCRNSSWSRPGAPGKPGQWTHAGPVAVADALWWLDSELEPDPKPPPAVADGYGLVTAYPVFGAEPDDHAPSTLTALVEDLAVRMNTEGRHGDAVEGTAWEGFVAGARAYVAARGLSEVHPVETTDSPSADWVAARVAQGEAVVLLLGVWQSDPPRRVGGHYAAVAGAGTEPDTVALADPLADRGGALGRQLPDPDGHSCREAPAGHDDPGRVSHDGYALVPSDLPKGRRILDGYLGPANVGEAAAFAGQNPSLALRRYAASWDGGPSVMAVDAALAIGHGTSAVASPTPPPASSTPTADPATPTSGPPSPTGSSGSASPVAPPSPTITLATPTSARFQATPWPAAEPSSTPWPTVANGQAPRLVLPGRFRARGRRVYLPSVLRLILRRP